MMEHRSKKRRRVTDRQSCFQTEESNPRPTNDTQEEGSSLSYLVLSKSWQAAALRAKSHPQEAQTGCATSLARKPVPLDSHNSKYSHNSSQTNSNMLSSPLAIACRYGAPLETIQAILDANPFMIRRCIPNRGTPLHEAIMTFHGTPQQHSSTRLERKDYEYEQVISLLLQADEHIYQQELQNGSSTLTKRATLFQDVDGNTPLHLLVRHAFYNYVANISGRQINPSIMSVFHQLISSSPQASSMPDLSEFEETPLILVLKSSLHAHEQYQYRQRHLQYIHHDPSSPNLRYEFENDRRRHEEDVVNFNSNLEHGIFQACKLMLQDNPSAASVVASKTGYTPIHSAVYHGRCSDTIRLLLKADCDYLNSLMTQSSPSTDCNTEHHSSSNGNLIAATMRTNRFGETPLHFAAMRGECTKTIKLLSQAAPWAALKRDENHGLTPLHWLLARFFVTMSDAFDWNRDFDTNTEHDNENDAHRGGKAGPDSRGFLLHSNAQNSFHVGQQSKLSLHDPTSEFALENDEQIQFDLEYHRRTCAIDPPCDYTQMRHILSQNDHALMEDKLVARIINVLTRVRASHLKFKERIKQMQSSNRTKMHDNTFDKNDLKVCPFQGNRSGLKTSTRIRTKEGVYPSTVNGDSTNTVVVTDNHPSQKSSNGRCPFNQIARADGPNPTESKLKGGNSSSLAKTCPYFQSINANQPDYSTTDEDMKRCPFRCPFVFESYPIDATILGVEGDALREEKIISLFWAKVNSLLHAAAITKIVKIGSATPCFPSVPRDSSIDMLHTACSTPTSVAVIRVCAALYPEQLKVQDSEGKLPLHHAACRVWHPREFSNINVASSSDDDLNEGNVEPVNLLCLESYRTLQFILESSDEKASIKRDMNGRIPFHYAIDSVLEAIFCSIDFYNKDSSFSGMDDKTIFSAVGVLNSMIQKFPEVIEQRDGVTGLYPFMQASGKSSELLRSFKNRKISGKNEHDIETRSNSLALSICYELLLASPSIVLVGRN